MFLFGLSPWGVQMCKGGIGALLADVVDVVDRGPGARFRDPDGSVLLDCQGFLELRLQAVGTTMCLLL